MPNTDKVPIRRPHSCMTAKGVDGGSQCDGEVGVASEQPPPDQPMNTSRFVFTGVAVSVTLVPVGSLAEHTEPPLASWCYRAVGGRYGVVPPPKAVIVLRLPFPVGPSNPGFAVQR